MSRANHGGSIGRLRDECLNETLFSSLSHARSVLTAWKHAYNHRRPRSAHGGATPTEFGVSLGLSDEKIQSELAEIVSANVATMIKDDKRRFSKSIKRARERLHFIQAQETTRHKKLITKKAPNHEE